MKNFLVKVLVAMPLLAACNGVSNAPNANPNNSDAELGADSSGGADYHSIFENTAWFRDASRTIQVCYEVDPAFTGPTGNLKEQIGNAFAQWRDYYRSKVEPALDASPLSFEVAIHAAASGGCASSNPDLTIYFGDQNPKFRRIRNTSSVAYVYQTESNSDHSWYKGYLWMSPRFFENEKMIYGILLHELGHVYGCSHVSGTVMADDYVDQITKRASANSSQDFKDLYERAKDARMSKIDQERELTAGDTIDYTLSRSSCREPSGVPCWLPGLFSDLMGRRPEGKIHVRMHRSNNTHIVFDEFAELTFSDDLGSKSFKLKQVDFIYFASQAHAFRWEVVGALNDRGVAPITGRSYEAGEGGIRKFELINPDNGGIYKVEVIRNAGYVGSVVAYDLTEFSPIEMRIRKPSDFYVIDLYMKRTNWL